MYYYYFCVLFKRVELLNQSKKRIALLKVVEKKQRLTRNRQPFVCNIR